jgi:hypothetical protein
MRYKVKYANKFATTLRRKIHFLPDLLKLPKGNEMKVQM